jgi:hypothetical protein
LPRKSAVAAALCQRSPKAVACPTAGCRFEFSAKTIQPLTKLLREELEKL